MFENVDNFSKSEKTKKQPSFATLTNQKRLLTPSLAMPVKSAPLCFASLRDGFRYAPATHDRRKSGVQELPRHNGAKDAMCVFSNFNKKI